MLRSLKEDAEAYLKEEVTEAVISVPAYFDDTSAALCRFPLVLASRASSSIFFFWRNIFSSTESGGEGSDSHGRVFLYPGHRGDGKPRKRPL